MNPFSIVHRMTAFRMRTEDAAAQRCSASKKDCPMRVFFAAVVLLLAAFLGTAVSADISCTFAQGRSEVQEAAPPYWKMYYHFAPPTDAFIAELAAAQSLPYTQGKEGDARFYADDGRPIYPSNDGAVGATLTVVLPPGEVLTRYGAPTGRYTSSAVTTFEQRALPRTTRESDFRIYDRAAGDCGRRKGGRRAVVLAYGRRHSVQAAPSDLRADGDGAADAEGAEDARARLGGAADAGGRGCRSATCRRFPRGIICCGAMEHRKADASPCLAHCHRAGFMYTWTCRALS